MRLLLITQVVDSTNSSLGFFHSWIEKLAQYFDSIDVICLFEGAHNLPENVRIHSLGKEKGRGSKLMYSVRFLRLIWTLRHQYERVFVHMNQEYVLLGGLYWKLTGKKIYFWRNHYAGSLLTRMAVALSSIVFCTSAYSYTAKFKKTKLMPVGVDIERFKTHTAEKKPRSILFLGRMTPSKKPDVLLEALILLANQGIDFTVTFCGPVLPEDSTYVNSLKKRSLIISDHVTFIDGVPHTETANIYSRHEIYVNLGASGMFDKTLFEAAASGCLVIATSDDFQKRMEHSYHVSIQTAAELAVTLAHFLSLTPEDRKRIQTEQSAVAEKEGLEILIKKVASDILA